MRPGDALPARYEGPDALRRETGRALCALHAWALFDLLKLWTSELEPEICIDGRGDLRGLGYGGRLVLPIERLRSEG